MKLELRSDAGLVSAVIVTLSARNLYALLHKLSLPGSARTLVSEHAYRQDRLADDLVLVVQAEPDVDHYGRRGFGPGPLHPATEAYLTSLERKERS